MIQKYFKRDPNVNRDSNAFKNNVLLIDLSRGVSLKRSLRLVCVRNYVLPTKARLGKVHITQVSFGTFITHLGTFF